MTRARSEDGFTLVELIAAIALTSIMVGVLGAGLVVFLRSAGANADRLDASHDAQLASIYLPQDIRSAADVATSGTGCSGVSNLLHLRWTATEAAAGAPITYDAAYAIRPDGTDWTLVRYSCKTGSAMTSRKVAHGLAGTDAGSVVVEDPEVTVTLHGKPTAADPSGYRYTLSGVRRAG